MCVQCTLYSVKHITTQYTCAVFTLYPHTYIVDMQILYPLVYISAHIYCGYENILAHNARAYKLTLYVCAYPY